jgi:hypothetical protein
LTQLSPAPQQIVCPPTSAQGLGHVQVQLVGSSTWGAVQVGSAGQTQVQSASGTSGGAQAFVQTHCPLASQPLLAPVHGTPQAPQFWFVVRAVQLPPQQPFVGLAGSHSVPSARFATPQNPSTQAACRHGLLGAGQSAAVAQPAWKHWPPPPAQLSPSGQHRTRGWPAASTERQQLVPGAQQAVARSPPGTKAQQMAPLGQVLEPQVASKQTQVTGSRCCPAGQGVGSQTQAQLAGSWTRFAPQVASGHTQAQLPGLKIRGSTHVTTAAQAHWHVSGSSAWPV